MTRGNQRDKRREQVAKAAGNSAKKTALSGNEMQRSKESVAEIMRAKQAAAEEKKKDAAKK